MKPIILLSVLLLSGINSQIINQDLQAHLGPRYNPVHSIESVPNLFFHWHSKLQNLCVGCFLQKSTIASNE